MVNKARGIAVPVLRGLMEAMCCFGVLVVWKVLDTCYHGLQQGPISLLLAGETALNLKGAGLLSPEDFGVSSHLSTTATTIRPLLFDCCLLFGG